MPVVLVLVNGALDGGADVAADVPSLSLLVEVCKDLAASFLLEAKVTLSIGFEVPNSL